MTMYDLLADVALAVRRAATRRGWTDDPSWTAVRSTLDVDYPPGPDDEGDGPRSTSAPGGPAGPLDMMSSLFRLSGVECALLVVAAAADLDPTLATAYGLLSGAEGPSPVSAGLAWELVGLGAVDVAARPLLAPSAPLRRWGLLNVQDFDLSWRARLTVPSDVIDALLGDPRPDEVGAAIETSVMADDLTFSGTNTEIVEQLSRALADNVPLTFVEAVPGSEAREVAFAAFVRSDVDAIVFDTRRRPAESSLLTAARAAVRRSGLTGCGLVVDVGDELADAAIAVPVVELLTDAPLPVVLVSRVPWNPDWFPRLPPTFRASRPSVDDRLSAWRRHLSDQEFPDSLLTGYRVTRPQIESAGRFLRWQSASAGQRVGERELADAVRAVAGAPAGVRAQVRGRTTLDDVRLPEDSMAQLRRLQHWLQVREQVNSGALARASGGRGIGLAALFSGSPGTGKTMAAHAIADAAGLQIMQVDLPSVVDKYIGETEKNLERVFAAAESANVMLFFDEADAIFGKRSEVKDARDRFANQEVSYLLQRMEQFDGVTVLATNLRGNLDAAFSRRLQFIIHFPEPDLPTRRSLLELLLDRAGPADEADPVRVDQLAQSLELAGGDLRNIVLAATFDATAEHAGWRTDGQRITIGHRHVLAAAQREYGKLGRRVPPGLQ